MGKNWYLGSADAIYQSLNLIGDEMPDLVIVVGADHVYRMDFAQMVEQHLEVGAACTVAAIRQPISLAPQFGVIEVEPTDPRRIKEFREKPTDPVGLPDNPDEVLASMGNYCFDTDAWSTPSPGTPSTVPRRTTWAATSCPPSWPAERRRSTTTATTRCPGPPSGTAATGATSGRCAATTTPRWTWSPRCRCSTSTTTTGRSSPRTALPAGKVVESTVDEVLLSPGVVVTGGSVVRSVLSPGVFVSEGADVVGSVLMNDVKIGRGAIVHNAILDKNIVIPPGARVGIDPEEDEKHGSWSSTV